MSSVSRSIKRRSRGPDVTTLTPAHLRVLADAASPAGPSPGQRTPPPSLDSVEHRRFVDLTLADLVTILWRAKEGQDTHRLVDLWLTMLEVDDHLPSVWETRTLPVATADWELAPGPGDEAMVERAVQGCTEALEQCETLEEAFIGSLGAIGVGHGVGEIMWGRGRILGQEGWLPKAVVPVHANRFGYARDYELGLFDRGRAVSELQARGWPVDVIHGRGGNLARLPAGKYVVHQPMSIHDYPTSNGLVFSTSRWWWVKQAVTKYWLGGAEFAGNPRLIGQLPQNSPDGVRDEFRRGLEDLAALGVIVLREGTSVEIVEGRGQASGEVWDKLAKRMDAAMSKRVLGSTLNVEVGDTGGNRALGESQHDVTISPRQKLDGDSLWSTWRRDVLRFIVAFNTHIFPIGTPVPIGRFVFETQEEVVDDIALQTGWVRVDEFRRSRGLAELGGEVGQQFVRMPQAPPMFSAPAPAAEVATSDPFSRRPWETAARILTSGGMAATATSSPSKTTTPASGPSPRSGDRRS